MEVRATAAGLYLKRLEEILSIAADSGATIVDEFFDILERIKSGPVMGTPDELSALRRLIVHDAKGLNARKARPDKRILPTIVHIKTNSICITSRLAGVSGAVGGHFGIGG